jgi:hypothetical protein
VTIGHNEDGGEDEGVDDNGRSERNNEIHTISTRTKGYLIAYLIDAATGCKVH